MKIRIIGGGPGGLYFAQLVKRADPRHDVVVYERNRPDDFFGFGVVFSDQTLAELAATDDSTYRAIRAQCTHWETIDVRHRGAVLQAGGHGFSAISRQRLLHLLQTTAKDVGVDVRYETGLSEISEVGEYDLLVGADGLNSMVRSSVADQVGAREDVGQSKFIWFGSTNRWDSFRFLFEENEHGAFAAHGYPFDDATCTFLVETDERSWRAAGLDRHAGQAQSPGESDLESMRYLESVFHEHLKDARLIANNSKWLNFRTVRCDKWHDGNVVLLGDAAHTAHFSVGSGTKMALEDALALSESLADTTDLDASLTAYERRRRPSVEHIQRAAAPSLAWWESFPVYMRKDPAQFVFHFLTRTPQVGQENLRRRDRRLTEEVEQWWAREHQAGTADARELTGVMATPITLGPLQLANRIVVALPPSSERDLGPTADQVAVGGVALSGAGLVLSAATPLADLNRVLENSGAAIRDEWIERWRQTNDYVHAATDGKIGLTVDAPSEWATAEGDGAARRLNAWAETLQHVAEAGFDVLYLRLSGVLNESSVAHHLDLVHAVRAAWMPSKTLAVAVPIIGSDNEIAGDRAVALADTLRQAGCDLIVVAVGDDASPTTVDDGAWRALEVSERIRTACGIPTMIDGFVTSDDYANTAILSGRADLCCGQPQLGTRAWPIRSTSDDTKM